VVATTKKPIIKKVRSQSTIFKEVRLLGFKMEEGGRVQTQILFINERKREGGKLTVAKCN